MPATIPPFSELEAELPPFDRVTQRFGRILELIHAADGPEDRERAVREWESARREVSTWASLARLRFQQDTRNDEARRERERADELMPKIAGLETRVKRAILEGGDASTWESELGPQALRLWRADLGSHDEAIEDSLVEEQRLASEYVSLIGSARFDFDGQQRNLSALQSYRMHADRELRHGAEQACWSWFARNAEQLDSIFDRLVHLRDGMAKTLGLEDFVTLGYRRMRRVDYDRRDVESFREQVRQHVVPLSEEIARAQARRIGVEKLRLWDEKIHAPGASPAPGGDRAWMVERAREMFGELSPELSSFYELMVDRELMDLDGRDGKAIGGFCTYLHSFRMPFIFANFNGTRGDVRVFTHEMGHAFQRYSSRDFMLTDYVGCTSESAEVHSMSLELLAWPEMERFFGDAADEFRRVHLIEQLVFLPYGVAVDHFQHEVYENPDASPAERHAMWREMERIYLPWRDYDGLEHVEGGGYWQQQRHIYKYPFYYIDYTLAGACALQFWARSMVDHAGAMDAYHALCKRGGSLPFREMTRSAGLVPPFEDGALLDVVEKARDYLGL